jgi:hypothetical protein
MGIKSVPSQLREIALGYMNKNSGVRLLWTNNANKKDIIDGFKSQSTRKASF